MKILLAGHNIDRETLNDHHRFFEELSHYFHIDAAGGEPGVSEGDLMKACKALRDAENLTPETISAAYARISRDPRAVDLLREEARRWVGKARRSNRRIVFGMGHASIAEHAVFNLDIIDISRYVTESIQRHRLCSFTEKSQRYIHLGKDYIVPEEVRTAGLAKEFDRFVQTMFQRYDRLGQIISRATGRDLVETGEDTRYVLPLCTTTQMGMTANARNLEYMLRCAASSELTEIREFGRRLFRAIDGVAPSVIRYTEGSRMLREGPGDLRRIFAGPGSATRSAEPGPAVRLIHATPRADDMVLEALRFSINGMGRSKDRARNLPESVKQRVFREILQKMEPWEAAPREMEYAQLCFEILISAAAFGQLKRHRMGTLTAAPYDVSQGITVPPVMGNTEAESMLKCSADEAGEMFERIARQAPPAAPYALLGAHRRKVMMQVSARELIHLSRLREDLHAQWDIRSIARDMIRLAREEMPLCMTLAAGKHEFDERQVS